MTISSATKLQQHGIIGLLTAILAVQGWGTVRPDDIKDHIDENGTAISQLRERQAELRFSIQLLASNIARLTEAIEKSHQ